MLRRPAGLGLVVLLVAAGCAPRTGSGSSPGERDLLSSEEMARAGYPDAYATVQSLRPQWLQQRGVSSLRGAETVRVYMDGSLLGGPEQLRGIVTSSIASIRYLSGIEASGRWGLDHGAGALVVSTRRE